MSKIIHLVVIKVSVLFEHHSALSIGPFEWPIGYQLFGYSFPKDFFWHQNILIIIPYIAVSQKKNADKNMFLEIAINTFCFIIDEDFRLGKNVPNQPLSY